MSIPSIRLLLLLALVVGAFFTAARASPPPVQIDTDVREQYYDVTGTNADEIFASISRQRLGGEAGLSASGLTESELSFTLSTTTNADSCRLEGVTLRAQVTVTLPKHAHPRALDVGTLRQWEAYEALVEFHEYRHVEIEFQGVEELRKRLERESIRAPGASAAACNAYVERAIQEQSALTRKRHAAFHAEESALVRRAQADLLRDMNWLDTELGRTKGEIDRLERELTAREAERANHARVLTGLTERFGNALPPAEYTRAEELAAAINLLAEEMNEIANARNSLVDEYNAGLDDRRKLADRLAWTR